MHGLPGTAYSPHQRVATGAKGIERDRVLSYLPMWACFVRAMRTTLQSYITNHP